MDSNPNFSAFWESDVPSQSLRSPLFETGLLLLVLRGHLGGAQTPTPKSPAHPGPPHPLHMATANTRLKTPKEGRPAGQPAGASGAPSLVTQVVSQAEKGLRGWGAGEESRADERFGAMEGEAGGEGLVLVTHQSLGQCLHLSVPQFPQLGKGDDKQRPSHWIITRIKGT